MSFIDSEVHIKTNRMLALVLTVASLALLIYTLHWIIIREQALQDSSLRGPEWLGPRLAPFVLPIAVFAFVTSLYELLVPRSLRVTPQGIRSLFWSLSWSEVTGVRILYPEYETKKYGAGSQVVIDVTPEAHARNKWRNLRDSVRPWLLLPVIPPPKYEIRCQINLQVPASRLAPYLRECHEYYYLRHQRSSDLPANLARRPT